MRKISFILITIGLSMLCPRQNIERFGNVHDEALIDSNNYRKNIFRRNRYRDSINAEYSHFLRNAVDNYSKSQRDSRPKESNVVRLIRYLLELDVALVYYAGNLAAAISLIVRRRAL